MTALIIPTIIAALIGLFMFAVRHGFKAPRIPEVGDPADLGMVFRQVDITACNGANLFGWHILANENAPTPTVLIMHGWGVNAEVVLPIAHPFYDAGFNVLLVDARNHGSSGSGGHSSMPTFAQDIGSAFDWLKAQPETGKIALIGHSVGAAATLLVASRRHDMDAVISIASFAHPEWLMRRHLQSLHLPKPLIALVLRYVERIIGHRYDDIAPMNSLCKIQCPVLLVHGQVDKTIPVADVHAIAGNCTGKTAE
ncbi:alpha/beta hydrolase, partial [Profundibacter sp.]